MGIYRDGTLSSFSGSTDQFPIKYPYVSTGSNPPGALIQAVDYNFYFDACIKIQQYLKTKLGKTFATLDNSTTKTNGYTYKAGILGTSSHTITFSSVNSLTCNTLTLNVPASFGTTPFNNRAFGIIHTFVLQDNTNTFSRGIDYLNLANQEFINNLQSLPQFFVTVTPTNPTVNNQFTLKVNSQDSNSGVLRGIAQLIPGIVQDTLECLVTKTAQTFNRIEPFLWNEPLNFPNSFTTYAVCNTDGTKFLRLYSCKTGVPSSSLMLSRVQPASTCYVEGTYFAKKSGPVLARAGLGLFSTTDGTNVNGWAIVFEEGTVGAAVNTANIKLVEFQNFNIGKYVSSTTIPAWGSGTFTTLATITLALNNAVRLDYNGTTLTVTNTTTSSVLFSTSSLGISGNFIPGYFAKAEGNATSTSSKSDVYVDIKTPLKVKGGQNLPTMKVNLMYVQSTDPALLSTETLP